MPHQPFWTALAAEGLDKQRRRMLQAGLLVLRYLDIYFEEGRDGANAAMNMRAFRRQVLVCGDNAFGRLLATIVETIDRPNVPTSVVLGQLAAFARLLEEFKEVALANDVWDMLVRTMTRFGVEGIQDMVITAYQRRAFTGHRLGRPLDAIADYGRAFECAEKYGFEKSMALASICACFAQGDLGAYDLAVQTLSIQMVKAEQNGWEDLHAYAATNRGHVYAMMKRHQEALLDFSLAINSKATLRDYDLLVMNIAACAAECGYFTLARDAHELTCVSATNAGAKISASINLIELAMWTNNRADFEKFSELAMTFEADARAQAYRSLYIARGKIFFGLAEEPLTEIAHALSVAESLDCAPVVEQINQDLRRFNMGGALMPPAPKTAPLPLVMRLLHKHLRGRLKEAVA